MTGKILQEMYDATVAAWSDPNHAEKVAACDHPVSARFAIRRPPDWAAVPLCGKCGGVDLPGGTE